MSTTFSINGESFSVNLASLPADITLNTFIREHAGLSATKFMCQEGGCGVCICAVTAKHPVTGEVRTWATNSCLTLLSSCVNWEITTSEGLGNKNNGYHAIQKRLALLNGTQCGYCSPGFVLNMYALLKSKGGKVTMAEVENAFGGNICRCTGYRSILDAMKSFAEDSNIILPVECQDIEDLTTKTCPKTGNACNGGCKNGNVRNTLTFDDGSKWFWPQTIEEIFQIFKELKTEKYMLVAGNTAHGVYRRPRDVKIFIDVGGVPELCQHIIQNDALMLGANLSLTETMNVFEKAAQLPGFEYCKKLVEHFDLIASVPVRNMGTLGGNLSIKHQYKEFPSDVFIVFEAIGAEILINEFNSQQKVLSLSEYLNYPMTGKLIHSILLKPLPQEKYIFDSYKIMPRAQNAHAMVNAAFLLQIDRPSFKIIEATICYGGINPDFIHATDLEKLLVNKILTDPKTLTQAISTLNNTLKPNEVLPDPSPEYRKKLAIALFYKFLLKNIPESNLSPKLLSGVELLVRPVSSGKQNYERHLENYPIGQPTPKLEGLMQTAGEAIFANDVPVQPRQVWGAFVTAKKVGATVTNIDTSEAFKLPGVVAFYTAKDIPGENIVVYKDSFLFSTEEELLASGIIKYYNQPIGVIAAESFALAQEAAELVKVTYSGGASTILATLEDVLGSASADRMEHSIKSPIEKLQITDSYDLNGSGKLDMGLQYHFFMEPHSTVVLPIDGGYEVYAATQWMDLVQIVLAKLLGIKHNEVQVKVRRIGGGYGGKASRSNFAACAAALIAYKLNRPARFVQSLESIMNTTGKRWSCHVDYDFYVKSNGRIVGLKGIFYEDAGYLTNESPMGHTVMLSKNCYELSDNFKLDGYMVFTDSPKNTACRAPGSVEGIALIENIIEHIAFTTGVDPVDVRFANLLPGHKMCQMMPRFIGSTNYRQRKQDIVAYNEKNRWRKRGLGIAIMEYHIGYFGQYAATVAIYHNDGTVIVSHGGIEMGQGMNTKIAQLVAHTLQIPMELVKTDGSNTINGANSMVTGGSVGSEVLCFAVRKCCNTINERLKPVRESLKDAKWQEVINEAYNRKINLIASDDCKQGDMDPYTVCALCLTEVEVDILTGNYQVSRVDILEDTGESLNPNVDIGQIEGAYMMGLGYWTTEKIIVNRKTGELKTNRTWNYKPPGAKDIPIDFRIELLPRSANPAGFMRSKATGEPAICAAVAVIFALQQALQSARDDAGLKREWIPLGAPTTPEDIVLNAGTEPHMLKL